MDLYRRTNTNGLKFLLWSQPAVKQGFKQLFVMAVDEAVQDKDLKGCFVVNTITELIPDNSKILDRLEENQQSFENIIYDYLKKGQGSGQLSTDLDLKPLATLLFTIYNGIKVVSKVHPDKNELLASVNLALSLLE